MAYLYEMQVRVVVSGDGMHTDGGGAMATARRLAELVLADDRVISADAFPADVRYLGKTTGSNGATS